MGATMVLEEIKKILVEICEIDPGNIELDDWLSQHGVDSHAGMELIIRLEQHWHHNQ